ncbi:hypothetical protein BS50DRAFT_604244 [Corynespora cassiicola Philippines]|uniref:Uncharacterized protein n=1 Tax=Corynespora cassiicola Philippines TaxID=1448308 RepID=A0A2T2N7F3_CORCC|nr:hypothetical protein BS50DRAFT_604244 [Corynespora cassiicola Philippines]
MTVEALSSNVVNYLVWRYLQEAGYGNAALQLSRCWIRDPETLPFAKNVTQHALGEQRYHFGRDHGRPYSVPNGELLTLDQGIPAHELAEEANGAVQEPPPKKGVKRKKGKPNGIDPRLHAHTNGDAMDIEHNGNTHVTNSVRAESEAVASEADSPTVAELPISTLSIGQSTDVQTDEILVADLTPSTTFVPALKDPEKVVQHTSWGPASGPVLLTAGKSLLKIHAVPPAGHEAPIQILDMSLPMKQFSITALCWHSEGEISLSAREESSNEVGEKMMVDKLIKVDHNRNTQIVSSTAGLVNTLRWNKDKELLLSISTDGERGSIKIWKNSIDSIPAFTAFTESAIFDALWISDSAFVVCGIRLFQIYEIGDALEVQRTFQTDVTWEDVRHDPQSGIIAAMGLQESTSYMGILHHNDALTLQTHEYPDPYPTDLDFRPRPSSSVDASSPSEQPSSPAVVLTTCAMSGVARVWDANEPFKCLKKLTTTDESQAFKIAFSPDGVLLAAAGPDAVTVWDIEKREVPIANWRARDWVSDKWDPSVDGEFSLGWDPDSSRLSIALGNQIAIIPVPR